MNDVVREKLSQLIGAHGLHLCGLPGACAMMLRSSFSEYPDEAQALILTLESGAVSPLLSPDAGPEAEARALEKAAKAGLAAEEARWAVASWRQAVAENARPISP